jgi:hypothetical protein
VDRAFSAEAKLLMSASDESAQMDTGTEDRRPKISRRAEDRRAEELNCRQLVLARIPKCSQLSRKIRTQLRLTAFIFLILV